MDVRGKTSFAGLGKKQKNLFPKSLSEDDKNVFCSVGRLLKPRGVVWGRTDKREFTKETTLKALRLQWPGRKLYVRFDQPEHSTQTALFGNTSSKSGEVNSLIPGGKNIPSGFSLYC